MVYEDFAVLWISHSHAVLTYQERRTHIQIKRSAEGYNHFAYWQVYDGKKKVCSDDKKEVAIEKARLYAWDKATDAYLKRKEKTT